MTAPIPGGGVGIREATLDDVAALARLHARCFADAWDEAAVGALMAGFGAFACIAELAGEIVGLVLLRVVADEGEVLTIAVAQEHRRTGLGRALMHGALATAVRRGARKMLLEVAVDNTEARALYCHFGFTAIARRHRYYGATDADVMALQIGNPD